MNIRNLSLVALALVVSAPAFGKAKAPLVQQVSRTRFEVSKSAAEKDLRNPVAQLSTFIALPAFGGGWISGIRVSDFSRDCLLPTFGLKEGDVVEMVNGQPIKGPSDIHEIGQRLAKARVGSKVRVNLARQDQDLIHTYLIVD